MKPGPKPRPAELEELLGRPGHRKKRQTLKPDPLGDLRPPRWMAKRAKAEWRRIAPWLVRHGLLTDLDVAGLAGYCTAYAFFIAASEKLDAEGLMRADGKLHPAAREQATAFRMMISAAAEFGLTPSSRGRLGIIVPKKGGGTALREILSGGTVQ